MELLRIFLFASLLSFISAVSFLDTEIDAEIDKYLQDNGLIKEYNGVRIGNITIPGALLEKTVRTFVKELEPFSGNITSLWQPTNSAFAFEPFADNPPQICTLCNLITKAFGDLLVLVDGNLCGSAPEDTPCGDMLFGSILEIVAIVACNALKLAPSPRSPDVKICFPIIHRFKPHVMRVLTQQRDLSDNTTSAVLCTGVNEQCKKNRLNDWDVFLPEKVQDEGISADSVIAADPISILQLTDLHVDLDYKENAPVNCGAGMPVCCREEQIVNYTGPLASRWGEYRCGLRDQTFEKMLDTAKERGEYEYVFLTGDYTHSRVWEYNKAIMERHIEYVTKTVANKFDGIMVYPVVGNHEPHVVNMYPPKDVWAELPFGNPSWPPLPEDFNIKPMYEKVFAPFEKSFSGDESNNFTSGGYYHHSPKDGHRIVVLNTNICSRENFWLGWEGESNEPKEQLEWLVATLQEAETAGEQVLIVGHIEPGSCYKHWSNQYNRIITRYSGIIKGSFFGHSHKPQYRVATEKGTLNPVAVSIIAGSGVPDNMNPAYSVYTLDGESWDLKKQELFILNLEQSRDKDEPVFEKLIDSETDLGLSDLSPKSVAALADKMICDQKLLDAYMKFHMKGSDSPDYQTCTVYGTNCRADIACTLFSSNAADRHACDLYRQKISTTKCSLDNEENGEGRVEAMLLPILSVLSMLTLRMF